LGPRYIIVESRGRLQGIITKKDMLTCLEAKGISSLPYTIIGEEGLRRPRSPHPSQYVLPPFLRRILSKFGLGRPRFHHHDAGTYEMMRTDEL